MRLASRLGLGGRKAAATRMEASARVKAWARTALAACEDTTVVVNEITCLDPGCPGIETIVLVMEPGRKTRALKIGKPLDAVEEADVREAVEAGRERG